MPVDAGRRQARLALKVTVAAQAIISLVPAIAPVIAAEMAPRLGTSPDRVGVFSAIAYLAAMVSGLMVAPWIGWLGPVRSTQIMLLTAAVGVLLAAIGTLNGVVLAALIIGASMGVPNPAFSAIMGRHAPCSAIGLYLSLRQAAAPAGIALAGLLVPLGIASFGWQGSLAMAAAVCVLAALAVGRTVRALDWRDGGEPPGIDLGSSLFYVAQRPALRRLGLVSLAYGMAQQSFLAYSVLLLVRRDVPLSTAAALLSVSQIASVVTRITLGHVSDRWLTPRLLLGSYGVAMGLAFLILAFLPHSPTLLVAGGAMAFTAATAMGWQGLMTAHLLRIAPQDQITRCASGNQVFTFAGAMLGPYLLSQLFGYGLQYTIAFVVLGAVAAISGVSMIWHEPSRLVEKSRTRVVLEKVDELL
jgi:MFS family permease